MAHSYTQTKKFPDPKTQVEKKLKQNYSYERTNIPISFKDEVAINLLDLELQVWSPISRAVTFVSQSILQCTFCENGN
jgi:hypothetical protein